MRVPQIAPWAWWTCGAVLCAAMWVYVLTVWPPAVVGLSDFYPRWYGTRELLLRHRDPYSEEITLEIQQWQRGRRARAGEDEGRFAYPLYVALLFAPTALVSFPVANSAAFWMLLAAALGSAIAYLRVVDWRPPPLSAGVLLLFTAGSFAVAFGVRLRQPGLLVNLLLALSLLCVRYDRLTMAGVFLAAATIKPQLTVLIVPWMLLWGLAEWRRRSALLWSFATTMAILLAGSEALTPGWMQEFAAGLGAYNRYTDGRSILTILLGRSGGILASLLMVAALGWLAWRHRRAEGDTAQFSFCCALALAATLVVIPTIAPHGQVLLLPAMFLLLKERSAIWRMGRIARHGLVASLALLLWPPLAATAFALAILIQPAGSALRYWMVPVSASTLLPLFVAMALVLARRAILGGKTPAQARSVA